MIKLTRQTKYEVIKCMYFFMFRMLSYVKVISTFKIFFEVYFYKLQAFILLENYFELNQKLVMQCQLLDK